MPVKTIEWDNGRIRMIDQTKLPERLVYLEIEEMDQLTEAIKSLRVRGAPAIGIAAAFGVLLFAQQSRTNSVDDFLAQMDETIKLLASTRPTAVNLTWALLEMKQCALDHRDAGISMMKQALHQRAMTMFENDRRINRAIGEHGSQLIPERAEIITHCNTGALATVDYGTALGVLFTAHTRGKQLHVWVDETRPLLQGARLNMWELQNEGIPSTLICDNTAAFVMQNHKIDLCIVGADRIARNGDIANKIGTYSLAIAAKHHGVPFYVAAPISTFDASVSIGADIPIEERAAPEVTHGFGRQTAPDGSNVYSPAFDITPNDLISAIVTEKGILRQPYEPATRELLKNA